jgi:hypothetical protein
MVRPFETDGVSCNAGSYLREAITGSGEAASGHKIELPTVSGACEYRIAKSPLRQRPERVRALVVKRVDMVTRADHHELDATVLELKERIGGEGR